jgi:hypothetical protein
MKFTLLIAGLLVTVAASVVEAQTTASALGPMTVPGLEAVPSAVPLGTHVGPIMSSGYQDGGRRDPFAALLAPKRPSASNTALANRPRTGIGSLVLADLNVRGLVKVKGQWQATLEGANKQSYVVRAKDKLFDATVVSVDELGVWFAEDVDEGMPPQKVRRVLRQPGEEAR